MARDKNCGIYKITNIINNKSYIGLSGDIPTRWNEHRSHYKNHDTILYRAMRKYSINNFTFEIIENCSKEELGEKEKFYIEKYRTYVGFEDCQGYNATLGGEDSQGYIATEETRKKMSENRKLGNNPSAIKVYVDDKIFGTIKEAAKFLGVPDKGLQRWLKGTRKIPRSKEHILQHKIGIVGQLPLSQRFFSREQPVECDGIIFDNITECAKYLNISGNTLIGYLKGRTITPLKFKNRGLKYYNKETFIIYRENSKRKSHYSFVCDEKIFNNIVELSEYLHCKKSSIYSCIHRNKNKENKTFTCKGKKVKWKIVGE